MLNFLKHITGINKLSQIEKLEHSDLQGLPIHFYCKDKKGIYLNCNDRQAEYVGFIKGIDLLGKTDFDLSWQKDAEHMIANDTIILLEKKPRMFLEHGTFSNNAKMKAISYKLPLQLGSHKIIGTMGMSFIFQDDDLCLKSICQDIFSTKLNSLTEFLCFVNSPRILKLSKRQKECLYFLTKGFTLKQIGKRLGLSPRTVEDYLDVIKNKLHCNSRAELVELMMQ